MKPPGFLSKILPSVFSGGRDPAGFEGAAAGERKLIGSIPFRWCPATDPQGFLMGSPVGEPGRVDNEMQHRVALTDGFWLAETQLTQGQWKALTGGGLLEQAAKALADDLEYGFAKRMSG